jgi:beta-xylosidase
MSPAGGVKYGWQVELRSKNPYGPYEEYVGMAQGKNKKVNGPHQGAWVDTQNGEDWFLHFQDKHAYGRVVHLQPAKWVNDWLVIGDDKDGLLPKNGFCYMQADKAGDCRVMPRLVKY